LRGEEGHRGRSQEVLQPLSRAIWLTRSYLSLILRIRLTSIDRHREWIIIRLKKIRSGYNENLKGLITQP
jgi:hypothetical protein